MPVKKSWHLVVLATLAALCMAPSCTEAGPESDAGTEDAGDAAVDNPGTTQRQLDSTADCKKRGECVVANGGTTSQSECEAFNRNDGERADSRQCTEEFDAYLGCVAGLTYDCSRAIPPQITAVCNAQYQALGTCLTP